MVCGAATHKRIHSRAGTHGFPHVYECVLCDLLKVTY